MAVLARLLKSGSAGPPQRVQKSLGDGVFLRQVAKGLGFIKAVGGSGNARSFTALAAERDDEGDEAGPSGRSGGSDKQAVLEYLQSQGINTVALADVELPKSVDVIKERLEFLTARIGLSTRDINEYPLMVGCSVRKNLIPVLSYLETHKVTKNSFPVLIRKYPQVLHASVAIDLVPNVRYIQGLGVELKQVGSLLTRYPQVLGFRIEGTMSTSVAYLVMISVNPRQIGPILTEKPEILGMRVANNLKPKVEFLVGCGVPPPVVGKMIENRPYLLEYKLDDKMRPAVDALAKLGVRSEALPRILVQFPDILGLDVHEKLAAKLPWLTAKVGVRGTEAIARILEQLPQILVVSVPMGTKRVDFLRGLGLVKHEIGDMVAACPQLLVTSIEKTMAPNAAFLVTEMHRDVRALLAFPEFLTYDLAARIRPRFARVKEKGLAMCLLPWMLNCSDAEFEARVEEGCNPPDGGNNNVESSFDVVGRLRVKEEVAPQKDDEDEDGDRNTKLSYKALPRARPLRSRPVVNHSDDDE